MEVPILRAPWWRGAAGASLVAAAVLLVMPGSARAATVEIKAVECWYCGPVKECPLPWNEEGTDKLNCSSGSCMKFDGWASDGKRVMMRDCGFFSADEIDYSAVLLGGSTDGTLAHCQSSFCNGAVSNSRMGGPTAIFASVLYAVYIFATLRLRHQCA